MSGTEKELGKRYVTKGHGEQSREKSTVKKGTEKTWCEKGPQ